MAYTFENWVLYKADVILHDEIIKTQYFFTRWKPRVGTPSDIPDGYTVAIDAITDLPYLKKIYDNSVFHPFQKKKNGGDNQ